MSTFVCPYSQIRLVLFCGKGTMIYSRPAEH